jgi:carbamoyltransferase
MIAGVSGTIRNATVALADAKRLVGVCSQERATRLRGAGVNASGIPDEAMDLLLGKLGKSRGEITRTVMADGDATDSSPRFEHLEHHFAHASTAYMTSPFSAAASVVCDHEAPWVSVWAGRGSAIERVSWPAAPPGFATIFSRVAAAFGFRSTEGDQRLEALARLQPGHRDADIDALLWRADGVLMADPALERRIEERLAGDREPGSLRRAALASALQERLIELFLEFLGEVAAAVRLPHLCVGGSFFYHSSVNTRVKQSGLFTDVFVPVDPGNSGLAVGAARHALGGAPSTAAPFLGPSYSPDETKQILDNCKLQYEWASENGIVDAAVAALREGLLVGWFDGAMEWGPRALGARSILASPTGPYVLENLNRFLKRREPWRGYALCGPQAAVAEYFDGPASAPFMECDYRSRDRERFKHALPASDAAVRIQTVGEGSPPRLAHLLEAFGRATGLPFLINSSFNGFHEPIVCSPRDAVRVFYGSGLDVLIINQFILRK